MEPGQLDSSRSSRRRATTSRRRCAWPTPRPARCATSSRRRCRRSSSRATAASTGTYLPASNEVIWFSERDNWGQLYLYDLTTGKLKNQITTRRRQRHAAAAASTRRRALHLLPRRRQGEGARPVLHPLSTAIGFDGTGPEAADAGRREPRRHRWSPSGRYFVDSTRSPTRRRSPRCATRTASSSSPLEKADISKLVADRAGSRRCRSR